MTKPPDNQQPDNQKPDNNRADNSRRDQWAPTSKNKLKQTIIGTKKDTQIIPPEQLEQLTSAGQASQRLKAVQGENPRPAPIDEAELWIEESKPNPASANSVAANSVAANSVAANSVAANSVIANKEAKKDDIERVRLGRQDLSYQDLSYQDLSYQDAETDLKEVGAKVSTSKVADENLGRKAAIPVVQKATVITALTDTAIPEAEATVLRGRPVQTNSVQASPVQAAPITVPKTPIPVEPEDLGKSSAQLSASKADKASAKANAKANATNAAPAETAARLLQRSRLAATLRLIAGAALLGVLAYFMWTGGSWATLLFVWVLVVIVADEFGGWFGYIALFMGGLGYFSPIHPPAQWDIILPLVGGALAALLLIKHSGGPFVLPFAGVVFMLPLLVIARFGTKIDPELTLPARTDFQRAAVLALLIGLSISLIRQFLDMYLRRSKRRQVAA